MSLEEKPHSTPEEIDVEISQEETKELGKTGEVRLLRGDEALKDEKLLKHLAQTFIKVYGETPWNEGAYCNLEGRVVHIPLSNFQDRLDKGETQCLCGGVFTPYYDETDLTERLKKDLTPTEDSEPILAIWESPDKEQIRAFGMGFIVKDSRKVNAVLLETPYFAEVHEDPQEELENFWEKLALPKGKKFFFAHETGILPEYRGDPRWYQIASLIAIAAVQEGCEDFIGVTSKESQFFKMLRVLRLAQVVHKTSPAKGEPLFMIHSDKLPLLARTLGVVAKAETPLAAASALAREIRRSDESNTNKPTENETNNEELGGSVGNELVG